ncbi:hypothetical protein [Undibacter mobilis]|uniref:hypothetical protein n=1 Tax=Undibacter mobilis TaxID=2292256 RepID=UPI0011C03BCC|nr:hypothetical protein [Undibacter mobilis]
MLLRSGYEEILQMRREITAIRGDLARTIGEHHARKYRPDQPRVPAGRREGGQWMSDVGGGGINDSRVISDATPDNDWIPGAQYAAGPRGPKDKRPLHLPTPDTSERVGSTTYRAGQVTIVNNAQTGLSTVDETTEKLKTVLEKVVNARPEGFGREYGKAIHYAFGDAVKAENLRGIGRKGVEHTFPEEDTRYGSKGTVRTDVVLKNDAGDVIAIYDVKTGNAYLDAPRVRELRAKTGVTLSIPVIEMHIRRGLSLKASAANRHHLWIITLRLWNPWIRDIAGRAASESFLSGR